MIRLIIQALRDFDYDECGENMKKAKGKHSMPSSWAEMKRQIKRSNGRR